MISKLAGKLFPKNTTNKAKGLKIILALILSNIFFFILFSGSNEPQAAPPEVPKGWVEVQLRADLLTPFQNGKKILLVHRRNQRQLEGMLKTGTDPEGKLTVLVKESEAPALFLHESWEILPFIQNLKFPKISKGVSYEIRY